MGTHYLKHAHYHFRIVDYVYVLIGSMAALSLIAVGYLTLLMLD